MDQFSENASYQLPGNDGSNTKFTAFPASLEGQKCHDKVGQYDCVPVHKSPRGDMVQTAMRANNRTVGFGYNKSDQFESSL